MDEQRGESNKEEVMGEEIGESSRGTIMRLMKR